jgi:hypothetical protein
MDRMARRNGGCGLVLVLLVGLVVVVGLGVLVLGVIVAASGGLSPATAQAPVKATEVKGKASIHLPQDHAGKVIRLYGVPDQDYSTLSDGDTLRFLVYKRFDTMLVLKKDAGTNYGLVGAFNAEGVQHIDIKEADARMSGR